MEEDVKILMKADASKQESLQSEVVPDPMEGEQTWPTEEELQEAQKAIATLGGKFIEDIAFTLPELNDERHILVIQKRKETPNKYPRKPGLPNKKPIQ